ncbi:hypothetical protein D3C84_1093270 [compost metagenome]
MARASLFEQTADFDNVFRTADERCSHDINILLNAEIDVHNVALRYARKRRANAWQVNAFARLNNAAVHNRTIDVLLINRVDAQLNQAVVEQNNAARLHNLRHVGIVDP